MSHFEKLPVTVEEIWRATDHDRVLSHVEDISGEDGLITQTIF